MHKNIIAGLYHDMLIIAFSCNQEVRPLLLEREDIRDHVPDLERLRLGRQQRSSLSHHLKQCAGIRGMIERVDERWGRMVIIWGAKGGKLIE